MTDRISDFANQWIAENISSEAYDPPSSTIKRSVQELLEAAAEADISEDDLVEVVGDLYDFISEAYDSATDNEVQRLADKDD